MLTGAHRAELEARAGVDPLDDLLYQRSQIVEKLAPLRALYGPFGAAEHQRKITLAQCAAAARARATLTGEKVTEALLDELARTSDAYCDYIAAMTSERARWVTLEESLTEINYRITRGNALLRYAANEPR